MLAPIATPRLLLRRFESTDVEGLWAFASDPVVTRYMAWPTHRTLDDTRATLARFEKGYRDGADHAVAILRRQDGRLLGSTGIYGSGEAAAQTGWILRADARGQGYAREAVEAVLLWSARAFPDLRRVEADIHPENAPSIRLAEALRMLRDGIRRTGMPNLDGRDHELLRFAIPVPGRSG